MNDENINITSPENKKIFDSQISFVKEFENKGVSGDYGVLNNYDEIDEYIDKVHMQDLTLNEKFILSDAININKKSILSWWLKHIEMKEFYKKFNISKEEIVAYIGFFGGEKILDFIIKKLKNEINLDSDKFSFITTKFLDFIKRKNFGVDDLLMIIIILKNSVIEHFLDEELKVIAQINTLFDEISTSLSKNYNDIVIKLLNEYSNAIDNSNIITKTDINGIITYANDEFCKLSGFSKEELIGKPHNIVRHPDMKSETFAEMRNTIKSKNIWKGIVINKRKDGSSFWVKSTVAPILDENNQIIEFISIRTDITELKEAYKSLEEYTHAMNQTSMILKLDSDGKIREVNKAFSQMAGYKIENLLGKCFFPEDICNVGNNGEFSNIPILSKDDLIEINRYLTQKTPRKGLIKNKSKYGHFFWTSASIVPISDLSNDISEYIIFLTDVTDLEVAQQKLKLSYNRLKELDSRKDDFINIASHELRTPMTSIKGYISMIIDGDAGDISDEAKTYLNQVFKSSERLLQLINDMLDVSKIESGKQEFSYDETNINKLIEETVNEIKHLFLSKNQDFKINIDFEDFLYNTDQNKLKQVLFNLLGNANKFTPAGKTIELKAYKDLNFVYISVIDSGIGIAPEDHKKVFEKFGQVKNSLTRDINGTGLGLPIVKAIVEKMGGFISLKSEVGSGSTFTVNLPIKKIF